MFDYYEEQRIARKRHEIRELVESIGGFKYWPLLNADCRLEVVKYLDYNSRCMLRLCSKADNAIVKKLPIRVHKMIVSDCDHHKDTYRMIFKAYRIKVIAEFDDECPSKSYIEWSFKPDGRNTRVRVDHSWDKLRKETIIRNRNYYNVAVNHAEKCLKACGHRLNELELVMTRHPFANKDIPRLPCCKKIEFGLDNIRALSWWLQKLPEQIESLFVYFHFTHEIEIHSSVLNNPQIMQASTFAFDCPAGFTDEKFLELKAISMEFRNRHVTHYGVNTFLKRWAKREGAENFESVKLYCFRNQNQNINIILNGLDARQWDQEFRNEEREFSQQLGRGVTCFQVKSFVDPFESVTLMWSTISVEIVKTGTRTMKDGQPATIYSIPWTRFIDD